MLNPLIRFISLDNIMARSGPYRNKSPPPLPPTPECTALSTTTTLYSSLSFQHFFSTFVIVNILFLLFLTTFFTPVSAAIYLQQSSSSSSLPSSSTQPSGGDSDEANSVDCPSSDPNFPLCRQCPCSRAGVLDPEQNCDEPCECKPSVTGQFCDQCKLGYVNLDADNPEGCTKCFCFNVTTSCRITLLPFLPKIISNPTNWMITTLSGTDQIEPQQEEDHLVIAEDDAPVAPYYYWSAPSDYLGDMYAAYGQQAKISLSATVLRGDSAGSPVHGPDIVLEGTDGQGSRLLIGHNWKPVLFARPERTKINRKIMLTERNWFLVYRHVAEEATNHSTQVTREKFVTVLSNLKRFLIRAYFHTNQIEGSFYNVDVLVASASESSDSIEKMTQECDCPEGYEKPSCGPGCEPGYRRVNNTLIGGICEKCDCNNHSLTCDPYTGECTQCLHNTQGSKCNLCSYGFYGFPLNGQFDDCKPCACPRLEPSNNFSPTCIAISRDDYVCDACQWPYTGPKCNQCVEGYTGNPTSLGGSCVPIESIPITSTSTSTTTTTDTPTSTSTSTITTTIAPTSPQTSSSSSPIETTSYYWTDYTTTESWRTETTTMTPYWPDPGTTIPPAPCWSFEATTQSPVPPSTTPFIVTLDKCQRSCAGLHLPDIWFMEASLSEINIDDIVDFPYALAKLRQKLRLNEVNLRESMKRLHFIQNNGSALIGGLMDELESNLTMDACIRRINRMESIANNSFSKLLVLSSKELNTVRSLQTSIHQIIGHLNSLSADPFENEPTFWNQMILKANTWINAINNIDLTSKLADAIVEREQSVVFLDRVSSFLSSFREKTSLIGQLTRLRDICDHFVNLIGQQVTSKVHLADQQVKNVHSSIRVFINNVTNNRDRINEYSESIRQGMNHLEGSKMYLSLINSVTSDLETMSTDLNRSVLAVERVRSIYSRLNPYYEDLYVNQCRNRVSFDLKQINDSIDEYNRKINLLKPYIEIPQTNNQIVVLVEQAQIEAETAINIISSQDIDSVVNQGAGSKATELRGTSDQIYREAVQQSLAINERSTELVEIARFKEEARQLDKCRSASEAILSELKNFTTTLEARSRDTIEFSYILDLGLKNIESKVAEINESLNIMERPQAVRLETKWIEEKVATEEVVNSSLNLVHSILDNVDKVSEVVTNVINQRRVIETDLADLRKRILLAQQKTDEIRIALSSDHDSFCTRAFSIENQPSSANTISLNYAIDQEKVLDTLLFSIVNPDDNDFLAIDMVDRSIRLLWSLGANGLTILEHPSKIETSPKNMEEEAVWYRIEAQRIGNIGTLNVQRVVDSHIVPGNPVKSVSSANYSILDVNSAHLLWIGGRPDLNGFVVPNGAVAQGFQGCLADLIYNEKHIGLWNFKYSAPIGCKPCSRGILESGDYGVFHFNGKSSYSVLDQIPRYDNRNYQVVLLLKTFDESAIIFFCSDVETGNYIALHMVNGHVAFSFRDGSETWLKLVTANKYNNGEWFRVTAGRSESRAMLLVDKETIEGEVATNNSDLGDCKIYFGGVPPNFTTNHWPNLDFKPFLGCMRDVQIDTTLLNLLNGETFGLSAGCKNDRPRSAKFNGQGYLELKGLPLRDNDGVSLTFKTNQSEAILLIATFKNPKKTKKEFQYYSLAITAGSLEARFNPGTGEILLISRVSVNDGHFHTVAITKRNRRVWMTVDDYEVIAGRLGPGRNIGSTTGDSELFLGGIPSSNEWFKILGTNQSLDGVIKDFITDGKVIYFNNFVTFDSVEIGRGI